MDFGALPKSRTFDPQLAPLNPGDLNRLGDEVVRDAVLSLGAPQWTAPTWVGRYYPKGVKSDQYLESYASQWNSIELNSSFYRTPSIDQIQKWRDKIQASRKDSFRFYVKVNQELSHDLHFWNDSKVISTRINSYVRAWLELKEMWAGSFLQLPPEFSPRDLDRLEYWIDCWMASCNELKISAPLYVEFRHPDWFTDRRVIPLAQESLIKRNVSVLITDTPGRRDVSHGSVLTDRFMVRFLAQTTIEDDVILEQDLKRIDLWAKRIAGLYSRGLRECAFFFHTPEEHWAPDIAQVFSERFTVYAREFGVNIKSEAPRLIQEPQLGFSF